MSPMDKSEIWLHVHALEEIFNRLLFGGDFDVETVEGFLASLVNDGHFRFPDKIKHEMLYGVDSANPTLSFKK